MRRTASLQSMASAHTSLVLFKRLMRTPKSMVVFQLAALPVLDNIFAPYMHGNKPS